MKPLRVLVLLLLALLLPVRGVVAATMDCAGSPAVHAHLGLDATAAGGVAQHHHGHPTDADHHAPDPLADLGGPAADPAAPSVQDAGSGLSPDGASGDTCPVCASGCGIAVLLTAVATTLGEPPTAQAPLPGVAMPALDFQLDGQDRPPRTL